MSVGENMLSLRFQVPTVVLLQIQVFWDVMLCRQISITVAAVLGSHPARRKDCLTSDEGVSRPATQHHVPEDLNPRALFCWDLIYISEAVSCSLTNQFLDL